MNLPSPSMTTTSRSLLRNSSGLPLTATRSLMRILSFARSIASRFSRTSPITSLGLPRPVSSNTSASSLMRVPGWIVGLLFDKHMNKTIAIVSLLLMLCGCVSPHRVVGDEYVVTSVEKHPDSDYKTCVKVTLRSLNKGSYAYTFGGNYLDWYTDQAPHLGDTVKVVIK